MSRKRRVAERDDARRRRKRRRALVARVEDGLLGGITYIYADAFSQVSTTAHRSPNVHFVFRCP